MPSLRNCILARVPRDPYDRFARLQVRWGRTLKWTNKHLTSEEMGALQTMHDVYGSASCVILQPIIDFLHPGQDHDLLDLFLILEEYRRGEVVLENLWDQLHRVPSWVDWDQIERGQKVFSRYGAGITTAIILQSFVHGINVDCMAKVQSHSAPISSKALLTHLVGTFAWLARVTGSLKSIQPGGEGHAELIRVRLAHGFTRKRLQELGETHAMYSYIKKSGPPLNSFRSMHTISLLSSSPSCDALPRIGISFTEREKEDYIALFRYIAYLLGIPHRNFETADKAEAMMESCDLFDLEPNHRQKILISDNLIQMMGNKSPLFLSDKFLIAGLYALNGVDYCNALGYDRPGHYYRWAFKGYVNLLRVTLFAQRKIPALDQFIMKHFHAILSKTTAKKPVPVPVRKTFIQRCRDAEKLPTVERPKKANRHLERFFWCFQVFFILAILITVIGLLVGAIFAICRAVQWGKCQSHPSCHKSHDTYHPNATVANLTSTHSGVQ
ncbi:hypothetical protein EG329_005161 [Mollisiaceae sp. DMI_Dod_QoI]|nr:hypothetical protein EG329_005161 [Helotiales sp. DMI_Dod_QoI]